MGQLVHNISLTQPEQGITQGNGQFENAQQAQNTVPQLPSGVDQNTTSTPSTMHTEQPSYQQAVKEGAGPVGVNALSPGLSKAGKLVTLLTSGLQGALAGRAAQEQMIAQSGGRRAGGVGTGFQAGYMLPWQRAQQQAQAQLAQMGAQPIQTEFGQVPAAYLPKFIAPMMRLQGTEETNQNRSDIAGQQIAARAQQGAANRQSQEQIHRYQAVPGLGLFDKQTNQMVPGTAQGIPITPEIAKDYNLPAQFVGRPMRLEDFSSLENSQRFNEQVVEGEAGPSLVNKNPRSPQFAQTVQLGLGNPSMGRGVQIGDPNNPGETTFSTMGSAIRGGATGPQSASVQVPKAAARAEVPTNIGNQKVAFNTALQHADLLAQAVTALDNTDVQAWNKIKNRVSTELGATGPLTAQTIANAYNHEITSMIAKGHMTNDEVKTGGATLDTNAASPQQLASVVNAYRSLAQSKMNMLNQQKQNAVNQSQPRNAKGGAQNDPMKIR